MQQETKRKKQLQKPASGKHNREIFRVGKKIKRFHNRKTGTPHVVSLNGRWRKIKVPMTLHKTDALRIPYEPAAPTTLPRW
jgi:hypothetical protein